MANITIFNSYIRLKRICRADYVMNFDATTFLYWVVDSNYTELEISQVTAYCMAYTVVWLFVFSVFLGNIKEAFDKDAHLKNLLLDDFFKNAIEKCQVCTIYALHYSISPSNTGEIIRKQKQ